MRRIVSLASKDLRLLARDKTACFFAFIFPVVFAVFFGSIFGQSAGGGAGRVPVAVVDEDASDGSRAFVRRMREGDELEVIPAPDIAAGERMVLDRAAAAYVRLPKGFGDPSDRMMVGGQATLELGVDPSRQAEAGMLGGLMQYYAFAGLGGGFQNPAEGRRFVERQRALLAIAPPADDVRAPMTKFLGDLDALFAALPGGQETAPGAGAAAPSAEPSAEPQPAWSPVKVEQRTVKAKRAGPENPYAITFPQGIIWGILGSAMGFGVSLVTERRQGTLGRLRAAPLSAGHILLGKALACFATTTAVTAFMLAVAVLGFGVRPVNPAQLALTVAVVNFGFVGLMMIIATAGRSEAAAGGVGWGAMMILSMLGGAMVPLFVMPAWVRTASHISPMKWALEAFELAIWRGYSPTQLILPLGVMAGLGVLGCALATRLFAWSDRAR